MKTLVLSFPHGSCHRSCRHHIPPRKRNNKPPLFQNMAHFPCLLMKNAFLLLLPFGCKGVCRSKAFMSVKKKKKIEQKLLVRWSLLSVHWQWSEGSAVKSRTPWFSIFMRAPDLFCVYLQLFKLVHLDVAFTSSWSFVWVFSVNTSCTACVWPGVLIVLLTGTTSKRSTLSAAVSLLSQITWL